MDYRIRIMEEGQTDVIHDPFTLVDSWQQTSDARGCINSLLKRKENQRKFFGLLESPLDSERREVKVLHKKLFFAGKSGVGKTSTIDKLAGRDMKVIHEETVGIQTHTLYWPVKLSIPYEVVVMVQLELWDTGERALQKFDHILPECLKSTDGSVLFFSYEDRKSWEDLSQLLSSLSREDNGKDELRIVVGTCSDSLHRELTGAEVEEFQRKTGLTVLPISNLHGPRMITNPSLPDGREGIKEITPFMNALSQVLLTHEHKMNSPFAISLRDMAAAKNTRISPEPYSFSHSNIIDSCISSHLYTFSLSLSSNIIDSCISSLAHKIMYSQKTSL